MYLMAYYDRTFVVITMRYTLYIIHYITLIDVDTMVTGSVVNARSALTMHSSSIECPLRTNDICNRHYVLKINIAGPMMNVHRVLIVNVEW